MALDVTNRSASRLTLKRMSYTFRCVEPTWHRIVSQHWRLELRTLRIIKFKFGNAAAFKLIASCLFERVQASSKEVASRLAPVTGMWY